MSRVSKENTVKTHQQNTPTFEKLVDFTYKNRDARVANVPRDGVVKLNYLIEEAALASFRADIREGQISVLPS